MPVLESFRQRSAFLLPNETTLLGPTATDVLLDDIELNDVLQRLARNGRGTRGGKFVDVTPHIAECHWEGDETFLDCVVREVHEELSFHLSPERFRPIVRRVGPDFDVPGGALHAEFFVVSEVPVEKLIVTEGRLKTGRLKIVAVNELDKIRDVLASSAHFALEAFVGDDRKRTPVKGISEVEEPRPFGDGASDGRSFD